MLIEDAVFNKIDFTQKTFDKSEYEYCKFNNCDFSSVNFSESKFLECEFENCNLTMVKLGATVFNDIRFTNCKMIGLNFEHCSDFGFSIICGDCILNHSSFYQKQLKNCMFKNCSFIEVDFTEANLSSLNFDVCNFANAKFENSNLENCNFSSAFNYSFDPEKNRIKKAKFSLIGLPGLMVKYDIEIE